MQVSSIMPRYRACRIVCLQDSPRSVETDALDGGAKHNVYIVDLSYVKRVGDCERHDLKPSNTSSRNVKGANSGDTIHCRLLYPL